MLYFILILVFVLFEIPVENFIMDVRDLTKIYYLSPNIGDIFYSLKYCNITTVYH